MVGFHFIAQNPSLITSNYLQKEFWISFKPFLKVLAHTETFLLLLLTQHYEHKFGESPMHNQIVFQNALSLGKLNHQHISKFMESDFYVFKDKFLTQPIVLLINGCPKYSASSTRITLLLNLENHSKICVLPIVHSPKV